MSLPCPSVCSVWASVEDVCEPCSGAYDLDQDILADSLQIASDVLFMLSGQQFPGICSDVVRPNARWLSLDTPHENLVGWNGAGFSGYGGWWGSMGGGCACQKTGTVFGCNLVPEIQLGAKTISAIKSVKVDGVTLEPSQYRIDDYRTLVRLNDPDGSNPGWPCCQSLLLPSTEVGTFEVEYVYGKPPPPAGKRAAAVLGCELALSCSPSAGACRLPSKVTSISRTGVSMTLADPLLEKGWWHALPEVSLFLASVNPAGLQRRSRVISPDLPRRVRRADTGA